MNKKKRGLLYPGVSEVKRRATWCKYISFIFTLLLCFIFRIYLQSELIFSLIYVPLIHSYLHVVMYAFIHCRSNAVSYLIRMYNIFTSPRFFLSIYLYIFLFFGGGDVCRVAVGIY